MSNASWQVSLRQTLEQLKTPNGWPRVVVVGIGNELRGDDASGIALARTLRTLVNRHEWLLVVEAGPVPENVCSLLRRFGPDFVLMVDAAQMNEKPGTVQWLNWHTTTGVSASTHAMPLRLLATYLRAELGCEVALLGIQPADLSFDSSLSPAVQEVIEEIAQTLAEVLQDVYARELTLANSF